MKHSFCTRNRPSWVVEQLYWLLLSYPFDPGAESQHSGFQSQRGIGRMLCLLWPSGAVGVVYRARP